MERREHRAVGGPTGGGREIRTAPRKPDRTELRRTHHDAKERLRKELEAGAVPTSWFDEITALRPYKEPRRQADLAAGLRSERDWARTVLGWSDTTEVTNALNPDSITVGELRGTFYVRRMRLTMVEAVRFFSLRVSPPRANRGKPWSPEQVQARVEGFVRTDPQGASARPLARARLSVSKILEACHRQREEALRLVAETSRSDFPDAKYVPRLYINRQRAVAELGNFASPRRVLALVGEAGVGKTNVMCEVAARLGRDRPVLFFNGMSLTNGLQSAIAEAFAAASGGCSFDALAPLLAESLGGGGTDLVVLVDAINETPANREVLREELNKVATQADPLRVRLLVSCQTYDWDFWSVQPNGMPTPLGRATADPERPMTPAGSCVFLTDFDEPEFTAAWSRYAEIYGLVGSPSPSARRLCHEPFMLRLLADTAARTGVALENIDLGLLFESYVDGKIVHGRDRAEARRLISRLADDMIRTGRPVVDAASISTSDFTVLRRLESQRIVIRLGDHYRFYIDQFLEYVVAMRILGPEPELLTPTQIREVAQTYERHGLANMPGAFEHVIQTLSEHNPSAFVALAEALSGLGDRWKAVLCIALTRLQQVSPKIHPILRDHLARDHNYVVRLSVANLLHVHRETLGSLLVELAADKECWEARETAAHSLGALAQDAVLATHLDLLKALMDDFHWRVRRAAGYAAHALLNQTGSEEAKRFSVELLAGRAAASWRAKYSLSIALLGTDVSLDTPAARAVLAMAQDRHPQIRWAVANYLPRYRGARLVQVAKALLSDSDDWVRAKCVDSIVALHGVNGIDAVTLLAEAAGDPSARVRLTVARRLGGFASRLDARKVLERMLRDESGVAFAAGFSLDTDESGGRASLKSADPIGSDCERVARGLLRVETAHFAPVERYISERAGLRIRPDSYMALIDSMGSHIDALFMEGTVPDGQGHQLIRRLSADPDEAVRWAVVAFLVDYGIDISIARRLDYLRDLSTDSHWWVRREVATALGRFAQESEGRHDAVQMVEAMARAERRRDEPGSDEVLHFAALSRSLLSAHA